MALVEVRNVQPEIAIAALRARGASFPATWSWTDMWQEEHRRAFTVAKSAGFDILGDIFDAVNKALAEGRPFEAFAKDLRPLLEAKGWWGKKEIVNPQTGRSELAQLGSIRRLKTIFDTNMRVSYAAGKWERFQRTKKLLPYLMYSAILDTRTRPLHARWGGRPETSPRVVLPVDHPWWNTHFPPNGWHCRCTVVALTRGQVIRMGLDPDKLEPPPVTARLWKNPRTGQRIRVPNGIDPGFAYNPGRKPLDALVPRRKEPLPDEGLLSPPWRPGGQAPPYPAGGVYPGELRPPLPLARPVDPTLVLPEGMSAEAYAEAFLKPFGASLTEDAIFIDKVGAPVAVGRGLFEGVGGRLKSSKFERGSLMRLLAEALLRPQEIWLEVDEQRRLVRRYLLRFQAGDTQDEEAGLVMFAVSDQGWTGLTTFPAKTGKSAQARLDYINRNIRQGFLAWKEK